MTDSPYYEASLTHVAKWDHSGDHKGRPDYVTFVGGPCTPGRGLQLPFKEWQRMGEPEQVVLTVSAGENHNVHMD